MGNKSSAPAKTETTPLVSPEEKAKNDARRLAIAKEILTTEESTATCLVCDLTCSGYVKSLRLLVDVYLVPLRDNTKILSEEKQRAIFSVTEAICTFQVAFLQQLNERISSWSDKTIIGDIFLQMVDFMKMYSTYINNYDTAIQTIATESKKNDKFGRFLDEARTNPACSGHDIQSYLIMPVQRLPRYVMLLQDLVKHTYVTHPDYQNLNNALSRMQALTNNVNTQKREAEDSAKLVQIQQRLRFKKGVEPVHVVQPSRQLVTQFDNLRLKKADGKQKRCLLWLMNDSVLYATRPGEPRLNLSLSKTKPEDEQLKFGGLLDLEALDVKPLAGTSFEITTEAVRAEFVAETSEAANDIVTRISGGKMALLKKKADRDAEIERIRGSNKSTRKCCVIQ